MRSPQSYHATSNDDLLLRRDRDEGDGQAARTLPRECLGRKKSTQKSAKELVPRYRTKVGRGRLPGCARFANWRRRPHRSLVGAKPAEVPVRISGGNGRMPL